MYAFEGSLLEVGFFREAQRKIEAMCGVYPKFDESCPFAGSC